jgi:hypothetical protein
MNDKDWRDCFAMFKSVTGASPEECYKFADEMLEARNAEPKNEGGIATIKKKRYVRKD